MSSTWYQVLLLQYYWLHFLSLNPHDFCNYQFVLLKPSPFLPSPHLVGLQVGAATMENIIEVPQKINNKTTSALSNHLYFHVSMNVAILDLSYEWNPKMHDFCNWFPSLSIMLSRLVHIWSVCLYFMPFHSWTFHYMDTATFSFFIRGWTFGLSLPVGYYGKWYSCTSFCMDMYFHFP